MVRGMIASRFAAAALSALALLSPGLAEAHPHIFIEYRLKVIFDKSGAAALRVVWSFDEMYSATLRSDYTTTPKGPITPADVQSLLTQHFSPVTKKHFFATATINGETVPLDSFSDFDAKFDGDKAVYGFTIPLAAAKSAARNKLEFTTFDQEYYIDFELDPDAPVDVVGGQPLAATCTRSTVWRETIGWGKADTDLVTCTYSGSPS